VAVGAKRIETRSWSTDYRGPLAIHAAKRIPPEYYRLASEDVEFRRGVLQHLGDPLDLGDLPRGAVVATCKLVKVVLVRIPPATGEIEAIFGDFTPGRYAWILANVEPLDRPIPAQGSQGLWEWQPPEVLR